MIQRRSLTSRGWPWSPTWPGSPASPVRTESDLHCYLSSCVERGHRQRRGTRTTSQCRTTYILARSLLAHPILWPWLGIRDLDAEIGENWEPHQS